MLKARRLRGPRASPQAHGVRTEAEGVALHAGAQTVGEVHL